MLFITFLPNSISAAKATIKQFCQFNSDCVSGCCYSDRCHDYNTCSVMSQINSFENANYCRLDLDCNDGSNSDISTTLCCFDQKCVNSNVCIVHYYVPLITGIVFALGIAAAASILINRCLKKQAERIKVELRDKQRRENIKRQKKEKKELLNGSKQQQEEEEQEEFAEHQVLENGPENQNPQQQQQEEEDDGFDLDHYLNKPERPLNSHLAQSLQNKLKQSQQQNPKQLKQSQHLQQQQQQHYNFIKQHMMNNQDFVKMEPQQQHQMILMIMQQQMQQHQQMMQQQQQQFQQMKQSVQMQKNQAPNPVNVSQQQQQQQPKKNQQVILQQLQQVKASQNSLNLNPMTTPINRQSQDSRSPMRDLDKSPKFFGKQNPNQDIISATNPLYPDYKPNVPNAGKMEENIIKTASIDNELNQKRSILNQNRGAMSKHLSINRREGNLPNEIQRV